MSKKIISFLLCAFMMINLIAPYSKAYGVEINTISIEDGIATIEMASNIDGEIRLKIYDDATTIYIDVFELNNGKVEIGLPIRSIPYGEYNISATYIRDEQEGVTKTTSAVFGTNNTPIYSGNTTYGQTPGFSRAVMTPYAGVYESASMGTKVVELKRLDIVNVLSHNDSIALVEYVIQSGDGTITIVDKLNASYDSSNDIRGVGYMYMSSFQTSSKNDEDKQREVVELAYSRLGSRGVYSQNKRYIGYYLDCSALASWCWYQVGVDFGTWTSCNGIYNWAKGTAGTIIWDAIEDPSIAQAAINDYRDSCAHSSGGNISPEGTDSSDANNDDEDGGSVPCSCTFIFENRGNEYAEHEMTSYKNAFNFDIFKEMQPGDIILFNYTRELTETVHGGSFSFPINETEQGMQLGGYDHAAVFVGMNASQTNVLMIESTTASEVAGKNTHLTTMTALNGKMASIVAIIRPIGGEPIEIA